MGAELKVPKLEMDMEEANILRWMVEEGAKVEKGEPVIEIDTDKVAYEVEANADGIIRGLKGEAGETVLVGATLAYIVAPGEEVPDPEAANTVNTGNGGAPTTEESTLLGEEASRPAVERRPEIPDRRNGNRRVRASPAARRAAAERGLALEAVSGSGPSGRIYLSDVLEADVRHRLPEEAPALPPTGLGEETAASSAATAPTAPPEQAPSDGSFREPLSRIRRVGAGRTARSFAEVPHFYLTGT